MSTVKLLFMLPIMIPFMILGGIWEIASGAFLIGQANVRAALDGDE